MTESDLLKQLKNRKEEGINYLYRQYGQSLYALLYSQIMDEQGAQQALTACFEYIISHTDDFKKNDDRFFTWLQKIARQQAFQVRLSKNKTGDLTEVTFVHLPFLETNNDQVNRFGVREFIKKLKPRCIQTLHLLFFKGETPAQAALLLDEQEDHIIKQNRQCIVELRNYLNV